MHLFFITGYLVFYYPNIDYLMADRWGKVERWQILFSWTAKSLWTVTATMKLKDNCSLEGKL